MAFLSPRAAREEITQALTQTVCATGTMRKTQVSFLLTKYMTFCLAKCFLNKKKTTLTLFIFYLGAVSLKKKKYGYWVIVFALKNFGSLVFQRNPGTNRIQVPSTWTGSCWG
jgi:hypothetical protein